MASIRPYEFKDLEEVEYPALRLALAGAPNVLLKNGSVCRKEDVHEVLSAVYQIITEEGEMGLSDIVSLVTVCRQPDWEKISLRFLNTLMDVELLDERGFIRTTVRDVLLSAVCGDSLKNIKITSPALAEV